MHFLLHSRLALLPPMLFKGQLYIVYLIFAKRVGLMLGILLTQKNNNKGGWRKLGEVINMSTALRVAMVSRM